MRRTLICLFAGFSGAVRLYSGVQSKKRRHNPVLWRLLPDGTSQYGGFLAYIPYTPCDTATLFCRAYPILSLNVLYERKNGPTGLTGRQTPGKRGW